MEGLWRNFGGDPNPNPNFGSGLPPLPCPGYLYQLLPLLLPPGAHCYHYGFYFSLAKAPLRGKGTSTLEGRRNLNFGSGLPLLPCPGYLYQLLPLLLPPWGSLLQLRLLLLLLLLLRLPLLLLLLLPQFPLSCSCCLLLHLPLLPPWGSLLLTGLKSTSADDFA